VKRSRAVNITLAQADAHQRKHGFLPLIQTTISEQKAKTSGKLRNVRTRKMNRVEREFSFVLDARKKRGELLAFCFEGVRLLWGGGMTYTPDFSAQRPDGKIELIEVKGAHIRDRDIVRFKGCRNEWQRWFTFEFHQRRDHTWHRLL